jgi:hypothetical protein
MSRPTLASLRAENNGELPAIAFPCSVLYFDLDGSELCADCANREQPEGIKDFWFLQDGKSEDGEPVLCDECSQPIDPALRPQTDQDEPVNPLFDPSDIAYVAEAEARADLVLADPQANQAIRRLVANMLARFQADQENLDLVGQCTDNEQDALADLDRAVEALAAR